MKECPSGLDVHLTSLTQNVVTKVTNAPLVLRLIPRSMQAFLPLSLILKLIQGCSSRGLTVELMYLPHRRLRQRVDGGDGRAEKSDRSWEATQRPGEKAAALSLGWSGVGGAGRAQGWGLWGSWTHSSLGVQE